MEDVQKDMVELPEVLEFLKLSRTVNRQIQLFKNTEVSPEHMDKLKKAAIKMKRD